MLYTNKQIKSIHSHLQKYVRYIYMFLILKKMRIGRYYKSQTKKFKKPILILLINHLFILLFISNQNNILIRFIILIPFIKIKYAK